MASGHFAASADTCPNDANHPVSSSSSFVNMVNKYHVDCNMTVHVLMTGTVKVIWTVIGLALFESQAMEY